MNKTIVAVKPQKEYELLDSGEEQKLERFGGIVLARPDPLALWERKLPSNKWALADALYTREGRGGEWKAKNLPKEWQVEFGSLTFIIRPTSFKHTGLFPEQLSNWDWLVERIEKADQKNPEQNGLASTRASGKNDRDEEIRGPFGQDFSCMPRVLNLFAYTGGATLAAARAGAQVIHVDASKVAVSWARENAAVSGLADKPIRWIVEDVLSFVKREIKRGSTYEAIIMDQPAFGHGPKGELWKIEEDFVELLRLCEQLLSDNPLFVLVSGYAAGYSPLAFAYNLERFQHKWGGTIECGDLAIQERGNGVGEARLLPCGIFARWSK